MLKKKTKLIKLETDQTSIWQGISKKKKEKKMYMTIEGKGVCNKKKKWTSQIAPMPRLPMTSMNG